MTICDAAPTLSSMHIAGKWPTRSPLLWVIFVLMVTVVAYVAQLPTPLRMNTDANVFLDLAASHADGHGFTVAGQTTHFPPGYPLAIEWLENLGLGRSSWLVGFNVVALLIATAAGSWVLREWLKLSTAASLAAGAMLLLGWGTIKHFTIPVSEPMFAATSGLALAAWVAAERCRRRVAAGWIFTGMIFTVAAIEVRSIGIALLPAAGLSMFTVALRWRDTSLGPDELMSRVMQWVDTHRRGAAVGVVAAAVAVAICATGVSKTRYFQEGADIAGRRGGPMHVAAFVLQQRSIELGSIVSNIPCTGPRIVGQIDCLIGAIVTIALLGLLLRRWRSWRAPDFYLAGYATILFCWPYEADVRFWIPVALLLFGLLLQAILGIDLPRLQNTIAGGWFVAFSLLGVAWLGYSTRITYSGNRFSETYGGDAYRATYRAASHSSLPTDPRQVNRDVLRLLGRYGKPEFDDVWLNPFDELPKADRPH